MQQWRKVDSWSLVDHFHSRTWQWYNHLWWPAQAEDYYGRSTHGLTWCAKAVLARTSKSFAASRCPTRWSSSHLARCTAIICQHGHQTWFDSVCWGLFPLVLYRIAESADLTRSGKKHVLGKDVKIYAISTVVGLACLDTDMALFFPSARQWVGKRRAYNTWK